MTWVIGTSCNFGYGILVSDIQVTYEDENQLRHIDVLQKVYHVGNHIVAGFAGSVSIGFKLIKDLNLFPPVGYENYYVNPYEIAENWPKRSQKIFREAPKEEQECGAEILMVAACPSDEGAFGGDKICIIKFSSPDFIPVIKDKVDDILNIGCGAYVEEYIEAIKNLPPSPHPFRDPTLLAEIRHPGVNAPAFARYLFNQVQANPQKGISKNLHIATISSNKIMIGNNNMGVCYPGKERVELKMPQVAQSYEELSHMLNTRGIKRSAVRC